MSTTNRSTRHAPAEPTECSGGCSDGAKLPRHLDLSTGELVWSQEDLRIPGRGLDFAWIRTYRSGSSASSAHGVRWDHAYNLRIETAPNGGVVVWNGAGEADLFQQAADGIFKAAGVFAEGRLGAAREFRIRFSSGGVWEFLPLDRRPGAGRVARIADRNGNALRFAYDEASRLRTITDTLDGEIRIEYDRAGALSTLTDFTGRRLSYSYYANGDAAGSVGDLKSVTFPAVEQTPTGNDFPRGATVTYTYATGQRDAALTHQLLSVTNRAGDPLLRVTYATSSSTAFDHARVRTLQWSPSAQPIHISYHPQSSSSEKVDTAVLLVIVNDANGNVREYRFDADDRCISLREHTARAEAGKPTTETENRPARPLRAGEPPFYETEFRYNADGLLARIQRPNGAVTERTFEGDLRRDASAIERGRLRSIRHRPGSVGGDQEELTRTFEYLAGFGCDCGEAFVTKATDARGNVTIADYDGRGNPVHVVERDGSTILSTYNEFGQLTERLYPDAGNGRRRRDVFEYVMDPRDPQHGLLARERLDADHTAATTEYTYDALGRILVLRDPEGHEHRHVWNAWDLLIRRASPPLDSAGSRQIEDTHYDANQKPTLSVTRGATADTSGGGARERRISRTYDALGRPLTTSQERSEGLRVVTEFAYDDNGNRVMTRHGEATSDGQTASVVRIVFDTRDFPFERSRGEPGRGYRVVTYDYDGLGQVARVARGSDADRSEMLATYDGYGRRTRIDGPTGTTVDLSYDANGNLVREVITGRSITGETARLSEIAQTFDAMDRRVARQTAHFGADGTGETAREPETWTFDALGQLVRQSAPGGRTTLTEYDTLGRVVRVEDADGWAATYAFDRNSNLVEEAEVRPAAGGTRVEKRKTRYVRDPLGRTRQTIGVPGADTLLTYDVFGHPTGIIAHDRQRIDFEYDGLGRVTHVQWTDLQDARSIDIRQEWDDSSRLVARTDPSGNVTRYSYDAADNLTAIRYPDGTEMTYAFDTRGNATERIDANGTRLLDQYDAMDRLVRRQVNAGPGIATDTTKEAYEYDGLGRLLRAENDRHTVEWRYDSLSRPIVQLQDGRLIQSTYDAGDNLQSIQHPSKYALAYAYGSEGIRISDPRGPALLAALDKETGDRIIRYLRTSGSVMSTARTNEADLPDVIATTAGNAIVDERRYLWDDLGNMAGVDVRDGRGARTLRYAVDAFGRLRRSSVREDGGAATRETEYEFDPSGNRTLVRADGREHRYEMDVTDRPDKSMNRYTATPTDRRTYDRNGNLIATIDALGRKRSMTYDFRNRMVEYRDDAAGAVTRYEYDCLGRRLEKVATDEAGAPRIHRRYSYDGDALVEEQDALRSATWNLLRHGGVAYGVFASENGERWLVPDAVGSIVAELNADGTASRTFDYDDYGSVTIRDEAGRPAAPSLGMTPVLFAGYLRDAESGLYYVRTRYLESLVGRFTVRDSAGVWGDRRNRGNAYAYAANNPATFIDPTGESIYRWYSCGGPSPGPRLVKVEYEGCSKARRDSLTVPVCRAFRGSGQASERVLSLWVNDFTGATQPGASVTRTRVQKWFGGPDNATSLDSKLVIQTTLQVVFDATTSDDFDIDCEGGSGCAGLNAYVNWGGYDVNLCPNFFTNGLSKQAAILIHELTHAYDDTDDYFYYPKDGSNLPFNLLFETPVLRENADTYEQFTLNFFLP